MTDHIDRAAEVLRREQTALDTCRLHGIAAPPSSAWSLVVALESVLEGMPAHDAAVAAKAWDEGFKQGGPMHDVHLDDPDAHTRNPYRKGETDA